MKCKCVQRRMAAYAEGGLRVADELAVDIHLIQCEDCRSELDALKHWERGWAVVLRDEAPGADWLALAEGLDAVEEYTGRARLVRFAGVWGRFFRGATALGAAALLVLGVNIFVNQQRADWDHKAQAAPEIDSEDLRWNLQYNKQQVTLRWIDTFDALPR